MNAALTERSGFEEVAEPYRFTLDDVFKMIEVGILDEDARVELIEGELVLMSPQGPSHARAKSRIAYEIARQLDPCEAELIIDSTMRLAPISAPEPDIYVFPAAMDLEQARGSDLLLLLEVADSSLRRDLLTKSKLYEHYGVREYWVFDVNTRRTHIHHLSDGLYGPVRVVEPTEILRPLLLPNVGLRMADFAPFR